jgi:hypothetical protein
MTFIVKLEQVEECGFNETILPSCLILAVQVIVLIGHAPRIEAIHKYERHMCTRPHILPMRAKPRGLCAHQRIGVYILSTMGMRGELKLHSAL